MIILTDKMEVLKSSKLSSQNSFSWLTKYCKMNFENSSYSYIGKGQIHTKNQKAAYHFLFEGYHQFKETIAYRTLYNLLETMEGLSE